MAYDEKTAERVRELLSSRPDVEGDQWLSMVAVADKGPTLSRSGPLALPL